MGFMDKAKKMAEQAQAKLDEAQKQFNTGQQPGQGSAPPVEYDKHGRPIAQSDDPGAPHGDPLAGSQPPPAEPPVTPTPGVPPTGHGDPVAANAHDAPPVEQPAVPPTDAAPSADQVPPTHAAPPAPQAPPAAPAGDAPAEDRNHPSYAPPKLSSGDPLAG
jgi:hypothetical protein